MFRCDFGRSVVVLGVPGVLCVDVIQIGLPYSHRKEARQNARRESDNDHEGLSAAEGVTAKPAQCIAEGDDSSKREKEDQKPF